jgi:hypothetical protein
VFDNDMAFKFKQIDQGNVTLGALLQSAVFSC